MISPEASGRRLDAWLVLILAAAAFLLFYRLDHRPFWQDEAETACLARNLLRFGRPLAYDGVNLISQEEGREFGDDHVWRWSPWFQIYIMAASFRLGGQTTWAGRVPFALCGWLTVFLVYRFVRRVAKDVTWARLSAGLLTLSVPFLLFARQGRSYSAAMLLTMLVLPAVFQPTRMNLVTAVLGLGAMFHLNYIVFAGFLCGLVPALWLERKNIPASHLAVAGVALALLVAPGFWWYRIASRTGLLHGTGLPVRFGRNVVSLLQFALPLPLLAVLLLRWRRRPGAAGEPLTRTLLALLAGNVLGVTLAPQEYFRYLVHLLPLCAIVTAWSVRMLWPVHRAAAVLLGLLLGLTNWLHLLPLEWTGLNRRLSHDNPAMLMYPNFPLKLFLTELWNGYPDVNAALIAHFRAEARPGDTILATYGDLPLQFYTPCRVLGGFQGEMPAAVTQPDWVIVRRRTFLTRDNRWPSGYLFAKRLDLAADYEPVTLSAPDEPFGNQPDPYHHRFIPPVESHHPLLVYRRKGPKPE